MPEKRDRSTRFSCLSGLGGVRAGGKSAGVLSAAAAEPTGQLVEPAGVVTVPTAVTSSRETTWPSTVGVGACWPSVVPVTVPVWVAPAASVYVTFWPISAAAVWALLASRTFWSSVDSASSFWTTLNCAVSDRNWVASAGLVGSWYLSWATSSLRKVSESSCDDPVTLADAVAAVVAVLAEVPFTVVMGRLLMMSDEFQTRTSSRRAVPGSGPGPGGAGVVSRGRRASGRSGAVADPWSCCRLGRRSPGVLSAPRSGRGPFGVAWPSGEADVP